MTQQDKPPAGYEPLVACQFCPPGGFYVDVSVAVVDPAVDSRQTWTMAKHGHPVFAVAMGCILVFTIALQCLCISQTQAGLVEEVRLCLKRAEQTTIVRAFFNAEKQIEGVGTGMVASYAMTLPEHLSPGDTIFAIIGMALSAKGIGENQFLEMFGGDNEYRQGEVHGFPDIVAVHATLRERRPAFYAACKTIRVLIAWGFLSSFAVASRTLHPAAVILICVVTMLVGVLPRRGLAVFDKLSSMFPTNWFNESWRWSCVGVPHGALEESVDATPLAAMMLVRTLTVLWACSLSLPDGLFPYMSLGRPMGRDVFIAQFVKPTRDLIAGNVDRQSMSLGTMCLRAFLLLGSMIGSATEVIFIVCGFLFRPNSYKPFRDNEFIEAALDKHAQIIQWRRSRLLAQE